MKQLHDWFGNCSAPRAGWKIDPFVSTLLIFIIRFRGKIIKVLFHNRVILVKMLDCLIGWVWMDYFLPAMITETKNSEWKIRHWIWFGKLVCISIFWFNIILNCYIIYLSILPSAQLATIKILKIRFKFLK